MLYLGALILYFVVANGCDYVLEINTEDLPKTVYVPVAAGQCTTRINEYAAQSWMYVCITKSKVEKYTYDKSYVCSGVTPNITDVTDTMFDCSTGASCSSDIFGFRDTCACSTADGNCEFGITYPLVSDLCAPMEAVNMSVKWLVQCGGSTAQSTQKVFTSSNDCEGSYDLTSWLPGCFQQNDATVDGLYPEMEYIICPASIATVSTIVLLLSIIVGFWM